MNIQTMLACATVTIYGLISVIAVASLLRPMRMEAKIRFFAAIGALPLVAALIMRAMLEGRIPAPGRFEAFACYSLAVVGAYLHLAIKHNMRGISGIVFPFVTFLLFLGARGAETAARSVPDVAGVWLCLHVLTAFVGYGLFTMASILAVAYLAQDYNLKHKRFGVAFERFPSLETLDHVMSHQIGFAFVTFSASLVLGVLLVRMSGGGLEWITDPKVAATALAWLVYAVLLCARMAGDRHGKRLALVTIVGLCCVLFGFVGIHVVMKSAHDFVSPSVLEN